MLHIVMILMWLLSRSFATAAWHLTSYLGSCHCPWPLISQVCISRDIWSHLPASDWLSVCISGLWLADSVITASPSQSPLLYRVHLSSHTRRQLPPVSGCTAVTSDQSQTREGRRAANHRAEYSTDITLETWRSTDYRSMITFCLECKCFFKHTGHWHLTPYSHLRLKIKIDILSQQTGARPGSSGTQLWLW